MIVNEHRESLDDDDDDEEEEGGRGYIYLLAIRSTMINP